MGFTCVADGKFAVNACTQYYECYYTGTQNEKYDLFNCLKLGRKNRVGGKNTKATKFYYVP